MATTWSHRYAGTEQVTVGRGAVAALPAQCDQRGLRRLAVVTGRSLHHDTPVIARVEELLGERRVVTFAGMREHTPASAVEEIVTLLREHRVDGVVAVGGGSPIDGTKAALYHLDGGDTPQIAVPTTLSAAEYTPTAGVTDDATRRKGGVADHRLTPRAVILDAELTVHTPERLWLSTGIRALDHAVETVYAPEQDRFATELALRAIAMLRSALPRCRSDAGDIGAREDAQVGAWYAGTGLAAVSMGPSHAMGRALGATFGIGHGITSCVLLAAVIEWTAQRNPAGVAPLCDAFAAHSPDDVGGAVRGFVASLGLPTTLREAGLDEAGLAEFTAMLPPDWAPIAAASFAPQ